MPKISVIIPVYNTEKYVEKCIKSVLEQTMQDLEIIVVNDGSTDNSEEIINRLISSENTSGKIKYFKKENGGLSDARNYGVKKATGDYISFLDSDDYIEKNLYKNMENYMDQKIDIIKYKIKEVNENGDILENLDGPVFEKCTGEEAFEKLCTEDKYIDPACQYLYRREFFEKNNFEYKKGAYHEDFGLTPFIIIQAKSFVSTNNFGYYYLQQRKNSITDIKDDKKEIKKVDDVLYFYDEAMSKIEKIDVSKKTKMLVKRYYTNSLLMKVKNLQNIDKSEYIEKIKKRKVYKNIKAVNLKQFIKKIILKFNISLYLNMK